MPEEKDKTPAVGLVALPTAGVQKISKRQSSVSVLQFSVFLTERGPIMSRKLPIMASLAAGCLLSTGAAFAGFSAPSSGDMTLWVNTSTGDVTLVGNNTTFMGYGVTPTSGNNEFINANFLKPFKKLSASGGYWNVLAATGAYLAEGIAPGAPAGTPDYPPTAQASPPYVLMTAANSSTTGPFPNVYDLGDVYNTVLNKQDLVLQWLNSSNASVPGWTPPTDAGIDIGTVGPQGVQYVPEPPSMALLAAGGLGLLVRRRRRSLA